MIYNEKIEIFIFLSSQIINEYLKIKAHNIAK